MLILDLVLIIFNFQHLIKATTDGVVDEVLCKVGENVGKNKLLVKFESDC